MNRQIKWAAINLPLMAILILAVFKHQQWAKNITVFFVWANMITSLLTAVTPGEPMDKAREKIRQKGRSINKHIDHGYDLIYIILLLIPGWTVSAAVYLIASLCQHAVYKEKTGVKSNA
jgi:hypothetical protein